MSRYGHDNLFVVVDGLRKNICINSMQEDKYKKEATEIFFNNVWM